MIVKGKSLSFIYKAFVSVAILILAGFCVFNFSKTERSSHVDAATVIANEHFSSVDSKNLIFSVEKVGVSSENDYKTSLKDSGGHSLSTMQTRNDSHGGTGTEYYYSNVRNGINPKYVVYNGEFVMLNNSINSENKYYVPGFSADNESNESIDLQEAIMVSFGQYVYNSESIDKAEPNSGANIQYVQVVAYRNGTLVQNIPTARQYDNNRYQDFVWIIPQEEGNEGYYEISLTYRYGDVVYNQTFNFYLLFETSYKGSVAMSTTGATGNEYNINPTLELYGSESSDFSHYYLGLTSDNYPTLTFDYTKYNFSYTHTANGKVTKYTYKYTTTSILNDKKAYLSMLETSSSGTYNSTYEMTTYDSSKTNNFVTFVFTEMGDYTFSFTYLYSGYNAESIPTMNLSVDNIFLTIHGFELKYSKAYYNEAQMRYLEIAKGNTPTNIDRTNIILPNGYEYGTSPANRTHLGVAYKIVDSKNKEKAGTILAEKSQDAIINLDLGNEKAKDLIDNTDLPVATSENTEAITGKKNALEDTLNDISLIGYIKTNQGALWLNTNDNLIASKDGILKSYYYRSNNEITFDDLYSYDKNTGLYTSKAKSFNNQTSFNSTGYYLIFVTLEALSDNKAQKTMIFAFQYSSDTISINVVDAKDKVIGSSQYTNQDVTVTWQEADIFERAISGYYYSVAGRYYERDYLLKSTTRYSLTNGHLLSSSASYLIELKSVGLTASYRMFTIDKETIEGVSIYQVAVENSGGSLIYGIAVDNKGEHIQITSSISDSLSSIYYADKASRATIKVTFTYTPFSKDNNIDINTITKSATEYWTTTNYILGTTIGSFGIEKPYNLDSEISYNDVISKAGIYIFTLIDAAGNSCKYLYVIDDTEAFFEVIDNGESEYMTRTSKIYSEDVQVKVGTHKAISLIVQDKTSEDDKVKELYTLISLASKTSPTTQNYRDLGYFVGNGNNISAINNLFNSYTQSSTQVYLTVRNNTLTTYDDTNNNLGTITISNSNRVVNVALPKDSDNVGIYRELYLYGLNQKSTTKSRSYVKIEINADNSRGMIYYSDSNIKDIYDESSDNDYRLYYGGNELKGTHATSSNYVAFQWKSLAGFYEVVKVEYDYYEFNATSGNDKYPFSQNPTSHLLYNKDNGTMDSSIASAIKDGENYYYLMLNLEASKTRPGLYVITRSYDWNGNKIEGERDKEELSYWFIVDRNGIIENGAGTSINIELLKETLFNEFSAINLESRTLNHTDYGTSGKKYNIYFTSNKVPATLNIPLAKYFDGNKASAYYAGGLNLSLYFVDTKKQIYSDRNISVKLMSTDLSGNDIKAGYIKINIEDYLRNNGGYGYLDYFINEDNDSSWICLPGDYILVITDLVESVKTNGGTGSHEKIIGFTIEQNAPFTNVFAVSDRSHTIENSSSIATIFDENIIKLTTNEEFIKINLNEYIDDSIVAQVDINYLLVKRKVNGVESYYIDYNHGSNRPNMIDLNNENYVKNEIVGGKVVSRVITLDTGLARDTEGNIDIVRTLSQQYIYYITIRFYVGGINETYKNCYYYFNSNGDKVYYYDQTYEIIIDREPPKVNIDNLAKSDKLISYYNSDNGVSSVYEAAVYETTSGKYFVNQYSAYYKEKEASKIYAFAVNGATSYSTTDISRVYYRELSIDSPTLNLPVTNFAQYTSVAVNKNLITFGALLGTKESGTYFEILELDAAGNMTQYVVLYNSNIDLIVDLSASMLNNGKIENSNKLIELNKSSNQTITIFDIEGIDFTINTATDKYYRFELKTSSGSMLYSYNTNIITVFNSGNFGSELANVIRQAGEGNYQFTIYSRTTTVLISLNFYDSANKVTLSIENLVQKVGNDYRVVFGAANVKVDKTSGTITYYAQEITITFGDVSTTYACISKDDFNYYRQIDEVGEYVSGTNEITYIRLLQKGTYKIEMKDAFGEIYPTYRFNTEGIPFYELYFEGEGNYYQSNGIYYGYTQATAKYDTTLFTAVVDLYVNNKKQSGYIYNTVTLVTINDGIVTISPYFTTDTKSGAIVYAEVSFYYEGNYEFGYKITIDSTSPSVALKDVNNVSQNVQTDINMSYTNTTYNTTTSGVMNLTWSSITSNGYFTYQMILHELMKSDVWIETDLTSVNSKVINTEDTSTGKYVFEVRIYTLDGQYLGNKLYTFSVTSMLNHLYYVQNKNNQAIAEVSSFMMSDITGSSNSLINEGILTNDLKGNTSNYSLPTTKIPLYISNEQLWVVVASDQDALSKCHEVQFGTSTFYIYRVYTSTYSLYLGILQVEKSDKIITSKLQLEKTTSKNVTSVAVSNTDLTTALSHIVEGTTSDEFALIFNHYLNETNIITQKNTIVVDVYYNNVFAASFNDSSYSLREDGKTAKLKIDGSGVYSFVFRDLAGNINVFETRLGQTQTNINFTILKQLIVNVNGEAPVENGYYNGNVSLSILNPTMYKLGTIRVTATRNGETYYPTEMLSTYTFKDYGTFRITCTAYYKEIEYKRVIVFTIINENESRESIDLTNISSYQISKVLSTNGKDVTATFLNLINLNTSVDGALLTYNKVINNSEELGIFSGKQKFTITYLVKNTMLPTRIVTFTFSLNNETPTIESSLSPGESTKKGFSITYNAGIIYEQVGDCELYINDKLVATINALSVYDISTEYIKRNSDQDAGDYYIKLVSLSGNVITSFKVEIKNPLNTWAIVIIVVAVLVVGGVITTIIVLRHRMRIR